MVRKSKEPRLAIPLSAQTLGFILTLISLIYALNRPVQAFNSLAASVDKLADVVKRLDATTTKQAERLDEQSREQARLNERVQAIEGRIVRLEGKK